MVTQSYQTASMQNRRGFVEVKSSSGSESEEDFKPVIVGGEEYGISDLNKQ